MGKMNKRHFLIIFALVLVGATNALAQNKSASETVRDFYKFHLSTSENFDGRTLRLHKKWFSPKLNNLLFGELKQTKEYLKENPNDKPFFGDGFSLEPLDECLANGKITRNWYSIGKSSIDGNKAKVSIKFFSPPACGNKLVDRYQVKLLKINGKWLIDDFVYDAKNSLTKELKRKHY